MDRVLEAAKEIGDSGEDGRNTINIKGIIQYYSQIILKYSGNI
jgi:hypothetical protein